MQDGGGPFPAADEVVGEGSADAEDFGGGGTSRRAGRVASSSRVMVGCSVSLLSHGGIW